MNLPTLQQTSRRRLGFTLIEMMAVLVVISVLLLAIVPVFMAAVDRRVRRAEEEALASLANGTMTLGTRAHYLPSSGTFGSKIGPEVGMTTAQALTNARGLPRRVMFDGNIRFVVGAPSPLPYTQGTAGSALPVSPRMMILSSVGDDLPTNIVDGIIATNTFAAIWNTSPGAVPSGWTWNGRGDDLKIQRVNLDKLFFQLVLNNSGTSTGRYTFDSSVTNILPSIPFTTYVMKGTRLGLYSPTGTLQAVEIINDSLSFICQDGVWKSSGGPTSSWADRRLTGTDLQMAANFIVSVPQNPRTTETQAQLVAKYSTWLQTYINYANSGYNSSYSSALNSARDAVQVSINNLIN